MQENDIKIWEVVVIGGGPAGMMAAGRAAQLGAEVLLLEKNPSLGKKLLITGGGRCNLTNNKTNIREMVGKFKDDGKFLFSAFSQFDVASALKFFNDRGMATKEENEGRIFPVSDKSQSVWDVLVEYMKESGVKIKFNSAVKEINFNNNFEIKLESGEVIKAKKCVMATGGVSRPETGSTGEGFKWLKKLGHKIVDNDFALVPIAIKDEWVKKLTGISMDEIKLTTFQNDKKQQVYKGKILFTHFGISGPTVLNMSKDVGELLKYGPVEIRLDFLPKLDNSMLKQELQDLLITESNKKIKNTLGKLVPSAFVGSILELSGIDGETFNHSLRSESRVKLMNILKGVNLHVQGLLGADKAIVSSGGVALEEVNFKTMESRIVPGLYLVGDVLNIDRPSGGYSLQLCWTTGYVAGGSVPRGSTSDT